MKININLHKIIAQQQQIGKRSRTKVQKFPSQYELGQEKRKIRTHHLELVHQFIIVSLLLFVRVYVVSFEINRLFFPLQTWLENRIFRYCFFDYMNLLWKMLSLISSNTIDRSSRNELQERDGNRFH